MIHLISDSKCTSGIVLTHGISGNWRKLVVKTAGGSALKFFHPWERHHIPSISARLELRPPPRALRSRWNDIKEKVKIIFRVL